MDLWAYCSSCARWFYGSQDPAAEHTCPVCGETSTVTEQRDHPRPTGTV